MPTSLTRRWNTSSPYESNTRQLGSLAGWPPSGLGPTWFTNTPSPMARSAMNAISRSVVKKPRGPGTAAAGGSTLNACMPGGPATLILAATLSEIAPPAAPRPAPPL